jgi:hypothetical protein
MKTSELTGPALDWAVAKCEGLLIIDGGNLQVFKGQLKVHPAKLGTVYAPSTDWAQGGPIIEREKIETRLFADDGSLWYAHLGAKPFPIDAQVTGPLLLVAAMRCYVASKLGDDIEVPPELN